MFNKAERLISSRNLKPKKKEGFLKIISIFSFLGIMLGVAILIIVMSVMNGFRNNLTDKILGFNPHIIIKPYSQNISDSFKIKLKKKYKDFIITESFSSEGVIMNNDLAKGILLKGIQSEKDENLSFIKNSLIDGNFNGLKQGEILLGKELAIILGVTVGDKVNILSPTFLNTPLGGIPKQDNFKISGVFQARLWPLSTFMICPVTLSFSMKYLIKLQILLTSTFYN